MTIERKFVDDGLKRAQINEYFARRLEKAGYGGMKIQRTPLGMQITILAEKPGMIIGKGGKLIKKLTEDLELNFEFEKPQIDVQEIAKPEFNAPLMSVRLAHAIERGWHFRKAGQITLQQIINAGARGCEIVITGKLTGPRARRVKFVRGYMKHSGNPAEELVSKGIAVARRKEGILGVKVKILPPDAILPDDFHLAVEQPEQAAAAPKTAPGGESGAGAQEEVGKDGDTPVEGASQDGKQ